MLPGHSHSSWHGAVSVLAGDRPLLQSKCLFFLQVKSLEGNLLANAPFMPKVMLCEHSVCKAEEETKCE